MIKISLPNNKWLTFEPKRIEERSEYSGSKHSTLYKPNRPWEYFSRDHARAPRQVPTNVRYK